MCIIYKLGPDLYTADWLSDNDQTESRDWEIAGMSINISTISTLVNMPVCTSIEDIHIAKLKDTDLQKLKAYMIEGCPHTQKRQNTA